VDGEKINYRCEISTRNTIMVETIDDFIEVLLREGRIIQEKLADQLFEEFGGSQRIVGKHKNDFRADLE
jgi:hypothetical protein